MKPPSARVQMTVLSIAAVGLFCQFQLSTSSGSIGPTEAVAGQGASALASGDRVQAHTLTSPATGLAWEFAVAAFDDSGSSAPVGGLTIGYRVRGDSNLHQAVLAVSQDGTLYLNGVPSLREGQVDALATRVAALDKAVATRVDALADEVAALDRKLAIQQSSLATDLFRHRSDVDRLRSAVDSHRHR
ncbi:MAG: hypothetical protein ABGY41_05425 [Candidatus Poribacteria bacterium]